MMFNNGPSASGRGRGGVDVRNVRVEFGGITALADVSVSATPGEVVGIIGPNGAGKTTLFNVMCGFVKPSNGEIFRGGKAFTPRSKHLAREGIARTVQAVGLCEGLTVLENVMLGADTTRTGGFFSAMIGGPRQLRSETALRTKALAVLEDVNAAHHADRYPGSLPFPEQKRVALARAMASDPDLLLLDEPAGGLGAGDIEALATFIKDFAAAGDRAVMLVEHHMDLVMDVCDQVFVLDFGRLVAHGSPAEIAKSEAVAEAYLGVTPSDAPAIPAGVLE